MNLYKLKAALFGIVISLIVWFVGEAIVCEMGWLNMGWIRLSIIATIWYVIVDNWDTDKDR